MTSDFLWGGAISANQTEGNYIGGGKGRSNFDMLPMDGRRLKDVNLDDPQNLLATQAQDYHPSHTGIDFFHHYADDIRLLHELGITAFRFSISWPRIFPTGEETVPNQAGLAYYRRIFTLLKQYHIEPIVTLSHFEIPLYLVEHYGGWYDRHVIDCFVRYAACVMAEFRDEVRYWIPFNEMNMILHIPFIGGGLTFHAGENKIAKKYQAAHHQLLANARVVQMGRKINPQFQFGCMLAAGRTYPYTPNPEDVLAANLTDRETFLFSDVQVRGHYPAFFNHYLHANHVTLDMTPEDLATLSANTVDFVSFSYYSSACTATNPEGLTHTAANGFETVKNPYLADNSKSVWQVDPIGLRITLNQLYERYELPLFVVENGIGTTADQLDQGQVHDPYRIEYLRRHFEQLAKARFEDGIPVIGYLMWGIIDLVSVSEGTMSKRYGVIYVDLDDYGQGSGKRYLKDSYYWYRDYLQEQREDKQDDYELSGVSTRNH
jgi:6-phospho-beta-glucosidase